jgi:hypothetical protein
MNIWKSFVLGLTLIVGHSAMAEPRTIALASEIALSEFRVPASANGVASFKACATCELQVVSVTGHTRYEINNRVVTLRDFRKSLSTVTNRERRTVIVKHHLESDVITSISINL